MRIQTQLSILAVSQITFHGFDYNLIALSIIILGMVITTQLSKENVI